MVVHYCPQSKGMCGTSQYDYNFNHNQYYLQHQQYIQQQQHNKYFQPKTIAQNKPPLLAWSRQYTLAMSRHVHTVYDKSVVTTITKKKQKTQHHYNHKEKTRQIYPDSHHLKAFQFIKVLIRIVHSNTLITTNIITATRSTIVQRPGMFNSKCKQCIYLNKIGLNIVIRVLT